MRSFRFSSAVLLLCAGASGRVQLATVSLLKRNVWEGPLGISKVYSEASLEFRPCFLEMAIDFPVP